MVLSECLPEAYDGFGPHEGGDDTMKAKVLTVGAAIPMGLAHVGRRLAAAAEALEGRMDTRWAHPADNVYTPPWGPRAPAQE
jgi:hypothetical protein